jgi:hypothetical protein
LGSGGNVGRFDRNEEFWEYVGRVSIIEHDPRLRPVTGISNDRFSRDPLLNRDGGLFDLKLDPWET